MWYQQNKVVNLKIAIKQLDGIVIRPGEIFSYWRLIGKPTRRKGYVEGMDTALWIFSSRHWRRALSALKFNILDDLTYTTDSNRALSS